jgi:hypothetical protein
MPRGAHGDVGEILVGPLIPPVLMSSIERMFDEPVTESAAGAAARKVSLVARFAALVEIEPDPANGRAMAKWLQERAAVQAELDGLAVAVTGAFAASVVWAADGSRSPGSWLVERTGCARVAASARLKTARLLRTMPHVAAAARRGELCADQVHLLTRARRREVAEVFDAEEADLVAAVRYLTVDATRAHLDNWHHRALETLGRNAPDGKPPIPDTEADRLDLTATFGGRGVIKGELSPESLAILRGAIDAEIDRWHRDGQLVDDGRSRAELQADACLDICRRNHLGGHQHGAPRPLIIGVVDADTLAGHPPRTPTTPDAGADDTAPSPEAGRSMAGREGEPTMRASDDRSAADHDGSATPNSNGSAAPGGDGSTAGGSNVPATPTRRCEIIGVGPVPVETIRRLLCEGDMCRVVTSGPSAPLDVGRKHRLATADQWRTLIAISGGTCEFGACETPATRCHVHHIRPWEAGGPTDLANEMLVCNHHHRCLHEGGFTATRTRDGVEIRRPDGSLLDVPYRTRIA